MTGGFPVLFSVCFSFSFSKFDSILKYLSFLFRDAQDAIKGRDGYEIQGHRIRVELPQSKSFPSSGGSGGGYRGSSGGGRGGGFSGRGRGGGGTPLCFFLFLLFHSVILVKTQLISAFYYTNIS